MKIEISELARSEMENWRAAVYERCEALSLGLRLGLGLAHLLELFPFYEDFCPLLV